MKKNFSSFKKQRPLSREKSKTSSWENVSHWYDHLVGEKGHYFQQKILIPKLLEEMKLKKPVSILDLACGEGIFSRHLPSFVDYWGVDLAPSLIHAAVHKNTRSSLSHFTVADVTTPLPLSKKDFDHALFLLALQSIERGDLALKNAFLHLKKGGKLWIVLNHPCFRIPRQTMWEVDPRQDLQYRRVQSYLSPLKIPIYTQPKSKKNSATVYSFHHSLSDYSKWLYDAGFVIEQIKEWISDKSSEGACAARENRARKEFPLFLALVAKKL